MIPRDEEEVDNHGTFNDSDFMISHSRLSRWGTDGPAETPKQSATDGPVSAAFDVVSFGGGPLKVPVVVP
ncbi:unnamed protein product [Caenorhabditis nigoni]